MTREFRYWNVTTQPPVHLYWVAVDKIVWSPAPTLTLYGYLPLARWMTTPPDLITVECWGGRTANPLDYGRGFLRWRAVEGRPIQSWTPEQPLDRDIAMTVYLSLRCKSITAFVES